MGIRNFDVEVLNNIMKQEGLQYKGLKMLQLGDQIMRNVGKIRGKKYFEQLGAFVISIDINGLGGSLPLDLSKPIDNMSEHKDYFDVITNFGTSEHVSDHIACFANMYYFCRKGGILLNLSPREGHWNNRSHRHVHKYTTQFYDDWAKNNNCSVLINRVVPKGERVGGQDDMILAILKKV